MTTPRPTPRRSLRECLWFKYLLCPFVIALLLAWFAAPSLEVKDVTAAEKTPQSQKAESKAGSGETVDPDLKERVQRLEERERTAYAMEIERQRKGIDWWLSFLAVVATVIAFGGGFIPYLIGRRDKEELQRMLDDAKQALEKMSKNVATSDDLLKQQTELLANGTVQKGNSPEALQNNRELEAAAKHVAENKDASFNDRLRAKAVEAELAEDYPQMAAQWRMVTEEEPKDAHAWFGWGLALQLESEQAGIPLDKAQQLRRQAGEKYALALQIKPDKHEAAYNWGNALDDEARVVAVTDGEGARRLWSQAGEKYALALQLKPDMHKAAYNWGNALDAEARVVADTDGEGARRLWSQAGEKYALALQIKPDKHEAANNWGNALLQEYQSCKRRGHDEPDLLVRAEEKLRRAEAIKPGAGAYNFACLQALRQQPEQAVSWLRASKRHSTLPPEDHIRNEPDFNLIRHSPEFKSWWKETFGDAPLENEGSSS